MEELFKIISNFGFPIALSVYLLFRFEKVLEGLQEIIRELVQKIIDQLEEIKELKAIIVELKKKVLSRRSK